jgi:hypothetical protein
MVSIIQTGELLNSDLTPMNAAFAVVVGLSSDQKPTGDSVGNGWIFKEMDTGSEFMYDAANMQWLLQSGGGGGGGTYEAEWTRQKENICFANLEPVGDHTWDVIVQCSDGAMLGSLTASYDSGIGDWSFEWGDWTNSEVTPVPDIGDYTDAIQNNIAAAVAPFVMHYPQGTTMTWEPLPAVIIVSRLSYVNWA